MHSLGLLQVVRPLSGEAVLYADLSACRRRRRV